MMAVALASGCGGADSERETEAEAVANDYLRAAAARDAERQCALRTQRSLEKLGGRAACERRLRGLAPDSGPARKRANADSAEVVPDDTTATDRTARVVVDAGEADVDSGHAVGGVILEMDLRRETNRYKVDRVGYAVFAD
jgi:hypothetical protein